MFFALPKFLFAGHVIAGRGLTGLDLVGTGLASHAGALA
jgi:hypothetical protein